MKFLAILRDSYREATSTWTLQVMLVLAGLLMLFVAGISFRLLTLEDTLANKLGTLNWALRQNPNGGRPQLVVENMTATNPAEPWASDYRFDVVVRSASPAEFKQAKDSGQQLDRSAVRGLLKEYLFFLDQIKVEDVPVGAGPASEARYHVTTTGTKTPDRLAWPHEPSVLFSQDVPVYTGSLRENLYRVEKYLVNDIGAWVALLVGVVITAGFVPNMLQKATLDLYIAKPISRPKLLVYKYVGGLTFVFLLLAVAVGGVWAIIGLRTGVWAPQFLAVVPLLTFYFAILYAVSVLVAVLTRSGLLAILATVLVWGVCWGIGKLHEGVAQAERAEARVKEELGKIRPGGGGDEDDLPPEFRQARQVAEWAKWVDRVTRPVGPRTYELDAWGAYLIADGLLTDAEKKQRGLDIAPSSLWATLGVSAGFIVVMLGLSCWRFVTRDG